MAERADILDCFRIILGNQRLDRFLGNAETGADQGFFARELFDLKRAKIPESRLQSVETKLGAMRSRGVEPAELAFDLAEKLGVIQTVQLRQLAPDDFFGQNFRRGDRETAAVRLITRLADFLGRRIDLQIKTDERTARKARARPDRVGSRGLSGALRRVEKFLDFRRIKAHQLNFQRKAAKPQSREDNLCGLSSLQKKQKSPAN